MEITRNKEARNRARIARYLSWSMKELGITKKAASKALDMDPRRIRGLNIAVPQLRVLHPLGAYIEKEAKKAIREKNRGNIES